MTRSIQAILLDARKRPGGSIAGVFDPTDPSRPNRRAMLDGWGNPGPIEERSGRRLLRLVDPGSEEWKRLLRDGEVELIGPEGDSLGVISLDEARELLRRRREACSEECGEKPPTLARS